MPYSIKASYSNGQLCAIKMDNEIYRVVHKRTGLAIQEFRMLQDSKTFIRRLLSKPFACNYLKAVEPEHLKDPSKQKKKIRFEYEINCNLHDLDVASNEQAMNCRYYNKPIYLDVK